ncbi:MAG: hypothetical protein R2877_08475 [Bdellovibrionota bacterium]
MKKYVNAAGGIASGSKVAQEITKQTLRGQTSRSWGRSPTDMAQTAGGIKIKTRIKPSADQVDDITDWINTMGRKGTPKSPPPGGGGGALIATTPATSTVGRMLDTPTGAMTMERVTQATKVPSNALGQVVTTAQPEISTWTKITQYLGTLKPVVKEMNVGQSVKEKMDLTPMKNVGDPVAEEANPLSREDYLHQVRLEQEAMEALSGSGVLKSEHISFICHWAKFGSGVLASRASEFISKRGIDCSSAKSESNHPLYNLTVSANSFPGKEDFSLLNILRKVASMHYLVITEQDKQTFDWLDKNKRTIRSALRWYNNNSPKNIKPQVQFWTTYIDVQIINILLKQGNTIKLRDYLGGRALDSDEVDVIAKYPRINGREAYLAYYPVFGKTDGFDGHFNWTPIYRFQPSSMLPEFKSLGHTQSQRWREFTRIHPHHLSPKETSSEVRLFNPEMRGGLSYPIVQERLAHLPKEMIREVFNELLVHDLHRPIRTEAGIHAIRNIYGIHRGWTNQIRWHEFGRSPLTALRNFTGEDDIYFQSSRDSVRQILDKSLTEFVRDLETDSTPSDSGSFDFTNLPEGPIRNAINDFKTVIQYDRLTSEVRNQVHAAIERTYQNNLATRREQAISGQHSLDVYILHDATFRQYLIQYLNLLPSTALKVTKEMADAGVFGDILLQHMSGQEQIDRLQAEETRRKVESLIKHAKKTNKLKAQAHYSSQNPKLTSDQFAKLRSIFDELGYANWVFVPSDALQVLYYIHLLPEGHEKNRLILSVLPDYLLSISKDRSVTRDRALDMALEVSDEKVKLLGQSNERPRDHNISIDLRDEAEKLLIDARDHQKTNRLILDQHLIGLKDYGQPTLARLKQMVGFDRLEPSQRDEFMNVLAALVAIPDVNEQKKALVFSRPF